MFIPDLGSWIQKQQKKRGVKKFCLNTFFSSHNFHKIENYFIFEMLKKKFGLVFKDGLEIWDPGSAKNLSRIRVQGSKRH